MCQGTTPPAGQTILPSTLHLHLPRCMYSAATLHSRMKWPGSPQKLHLLAASPAARAGGGTKLLWFDCCIEFSNISVSSANVLFNACISVCVLVLILGCAGAKAKGKCNCEVAGTLPCSTKLATLYRSVRSYGSCGLWFGLIICSRFLTQFLRSGCSPCRNNHVSSACDIQFLLIRYFKIAQKWRWNSPSSADVLIPS